MVEYVTKQTVIDELSRYGMTEDGEAIINAIPTADVVEVVRCHDCKHLCVHSEALGVYQCEVHGDYPSEEYFCADGERKDGGQDDV